jgi:hypothetical protein
MGAAVSIPKQRRRESLELSQRLSHPSGITTKLRAMSKTDVANGTCQSYTPWVFGPSSEGRFVDGSEQERVWSGLLP